MANASSFSLSHKWQDRLERLVSLERVMWLLAIVLFLVAWNRGLHLLYGMFSFLVAALLMSYGGAALQLRRMTIQLALPSEVYCSKEVPVFYKLKGKGQLLTLKIDDEASVLDASDSSSIDKVSGRSELTSHIRFNRRGSHILKKVTLSSCFPFGLITLQKSILIEPVECVVYPKVSPIRQLPNQHLLGSQVDGDIPQHQSKGNEEFAMVRDYVHGDEMRKIHWRMSAKRNEWIVKEFDSTKLPFMAVILNNNANWVQQNKFDPRDHMLEVVASLAEKCATDGCGLKVILDADNQYQVKPYQRDLQPLMYQLALWEGGSGINEQSTLDRLDHCPLILTFSNTQDGPKDSLSLLPHQHQLDIQFDHASYTGGGLKMGVRKRTGGRTTQIQVSSTTTLWGIFS